VGALNYYENLSLHVCETLNECKSVLMTFNLMEVSTRVSLIN
jgi:hypothetical protein